MRLTGTRLSEAALEGLARLPCLEVACLKGTSIADSALMVSQEARPDLLLRCDDFPAPPRPKPLNDPWVEELDDSAGDAPGAGGADSIR